MYLKALRDLRENKDLKQSYIASLLKMKQPQYARFAVSKKI